MGGELGKKKIWNKIPGTNIIVRICHKSASDDAGKNSSYKWKRVKFSQKYFFFIEKIPFVANETEGQKD